MKNWETLKVKVLCKIAHLIYVSEIFGVVFGVVPCPKYEWDMTKTQQKFIYWQYYIKTQMCNPNIPYYTQITWIRDW